MGSRKKQNKKLFLRYPVTAREAQKLLKHGLDKEAVDCFGLEVTLGEVLASALSCEECEVKKELDRLAVAYPNEIVLESAFGSRHEEELYEEEKASYDEEDLYEEAEAEAEEEEEAENEADNLDSQYDPKGTDEVGPRTEAPSEDSTNHGGGNASQEVEEGEAKGGEKKSSSNNNAQSQPSSGLPEEGNGKGSGSGNTNTPKNPEHRDAEEESNCPETGANSSTSGSSSSSVSAQNLACQQARPSKPDAGLESGGSAALPPVRDPDGNTKAASKEASSRNDEEGVDESKLDSPEPELDSFEEERQSLSEKEEKSFDEVDASSQGQSGSLEDSPFDWGDPPNSSAKQLSAVPPQQKKWGKSFSKQEREKSNSASAKGKDEAGGYFSSLKGAGVSPKLVKKCRRKLDLLTGDSTTEPSPRRDYAEFCVRLKSHRNPQPARKEETGRPVLLLMVDVSGSCYGFCDQSLAVAKAASKLGVAGSDVVVLSHSNGYPYEVEFNGKTVAVDDIGNSVSYQNRLRRKTLPSWYEALLRKYPVEIVIALGDWDAAKEYAFLMSHHQVNRFIWLDNAHCSSRGTVLDRSKMALLRLSEYGVEPSRVRHKLTYKDGCGTALEFVNNLTP